ncbi:MAG: aminocarboxymuconate-semialdehyde decarboxylase [bacterium]|jgi:predicted TIM-barrel fold metal-dependent hydrolase
MSVVDVQTYVMPAMELVYDESSQTLRSRWPRIEPLLALTRPTPGVGDWPSPYLRVPEDAGAAVDLHGPTAPRLPRPAAASAAVEPGVLHDNPAGRLRAMDSAGASVHVIGPALALDVDAALGSAVTRTILAAYNRYATTYCSAAPDRLKAVLQIHGGEPHWSARQLEDLGDDACVAGVTAYLPARIAPDSRNFEPIWRALESSGLPLVHRPGAGTTAWTPQRLLSYLTLSGVLDRHPGVTLVFAGWPAGWLADWCEAQRSGARSRDFLRLVQDGRVYVGIDPLEEPGDVQRVIDATGDRWLLWQSHFPFGAGAAGDDALLPGVRGPTRDRILRENAVAALRLSHEAVSPHEPTRQGLERVV